MDWLAEILPTTAVLTRLILAAVLGVVLGLDREVRGMSAGIRTHALVSVSSAVTTMSALMLVDEFGQRGHDLDPLRVVQGLAQAIGFIAAGLIFAAKGSVHNLTTAANIWLAAAVGIAIGAGQTALAITAVLIGVFILSAVRAAERLIPGSNKEKDE
jgi:putative Mg2+ transporter-C (MgtC) family protein